MIPRFLQERVFSECGSVCERVAVGHIVLLCRINPHFPNATTQVNFFFTSSCLSFFIFFSNPFYVPSFVCFERQETFNFATFCWVRWYLL